MLLDLLLELVDSLGQLGTFELSQRVATCLLLLPLNVGFLRLQLIDLVAVILNLRLRITILLLLLIELSPQQLVLTDELLLSGLALRDGCLELLDLHLRAIPEKAIVVLLV